MADYINKFDYYSSKSKKGKKCKRYVVLQNKKQYETFGESFIINAKRNSGKN